MEIGGGLGFDQAQVGAENDFMVFARKAVLSMSISTAAHFVFVDFENVPAVDLRLIAKKSVHVTLMIGKNQTKIDFALVEQIRAQADQIELVKLDASGRNALDLTLAHYLGRAVERKPEAQFCVVSKDKDFDPMIAHLTAKGVEVVRCDSFGALPFLPKAKKTGPLKTSVSAKGASAIKAVVLPGITDDRVEKLINRLSNNLGPRPKKKSGLLAHINTAFGNKLNPAEQDEKLGELMDRGILSIDDDGRITYLPGS
jgi:PIN domain